MRVIRPIIAVVALCAVANAALFETYHSNDQQQTQPAPAPRQPPQQPTPLPPFRTAPAPAPTPAPTPAPNPVIRTVPAVQQPAVQPTVQPPLRQRIFDSAPHGTFDWKGNFLGKAAIGYASRSREVAVDTKNTGASVYYRPDHYYMGVANGGTLTHSVTESHIRYSLAFGYQLPDEGNFWYLEYAQAAADTKELLFTYAVSLPSMQFANTIPFLKVGALIGYGDSQRYSPSSFGLLAGVGGYNYWGNSRRLRLEYGLDFSRTQWLPINHNYGSEKWTDNLWFLYIGATYKF
ncbi:hypothetical protein FACS1894103_4050 [Campylobacterota bacterium]|nr:hypothetical protein FACS1894103_4050 [Campylobacterota bacterium]